MEAAPENLNAQHLFQAYIAEMDALSKMFQESKLAGLVGSLKDDNIQPKDFGEAIGDRGIERAIAGEGANPCCAFAGLDHKLHRARVEPALAARNRLIQRFFCERTFMFLPHLILHLQPALLGHAYNRAWRLGEFGKPFSALDARHAEIRAQVQIGLKLSLGHSHLERSTT